MKRRAKSTKSCLCLLLGNTLRLQPGRSAIIQLRIVRCPFQPTARGIVLQRTRSRGSSRATRDGSPVWVLLEIRLLRRWGDFNGRELHELWRDSVSKAEDDQEGSPRTDLRVLAILSCSSRVIFLEVALWRVSKCTNDKEVIASTHTQSYSLTNFAKAFFISGTR